MVVTVSRRRCNRALFGKIRLVAQVITLLVVVSACASIGSSEPVATSTPDVVTKIAESRRAVRDAATGSGAQTCTALVGVPMIPQSSPTGDIRQIVLIRSTGQTQGFIDAELADAMSVTWNPQAVDHVALIGCIDQDEVTIDTCRYTPSGTVDRVRIDTALTLIDARTGEQVARQRWEGATPAACPATISQGPPQHHGHGAT